MENNSQKLPIYESINEKDYYEISLSDLFQNLIRRKNLIIFSTFVGIISSIVLIVRTPKTYEGEFQIVLNVSKLFSAAAAFILLALIPSAPSASGSR